MTKPLTRHQQKTCEARRTSFIEEINALRVHRDDRFSPLLSPASKTLLLSAYDALMDEFIHYPQAATSLPFDQITSGSIKSTEAKSNEPSRRKSYFSRHMTASLLYHQLAKTPEIIDYVSGIEEPDERQDFSHCCVQALTGMVIKNAILTGYEANILYKTPLPYVERNTFAEFIELIPSKAAYTPAATPH